MKEKGERGGGREDEGRGGEVREQREGKTRKAGGEGHKGEVSVKCLKYCLFVCSSEWSQCML